jgi:pimeloyl-ACP methyl ester carboxylesterase
MERWKTAEGKAVGWKRLSAIQPANGQVLITYGNGSCALGCSHYAEVLQEIAALNVFVLEYPGYGDRPGKPTERSLFAAADEACQLLLPGGRLYLIGESLGTGVASYLAGKYSAQIAGVALLAPYNQLVEVAQEHMPLLPVHLMLLDRYPSEDYLRGYTGPLAVLVAGQDQVVPEKFGRRLYQSYQGPKRLWEFPQGNHGTVMIQPPELWGQILEFWKLKSAR